MIGSITSSNETLDNPCVSHEFLLDTGAGRNPISNKRLPNDSKPFVDDAPEKVNFATGDCWWKKGELAPEAFCLVSGPTTIFG